MSCRDMRHERPNSPRPLLRLPRKAAAPGPPKGQVDRAVTPATPRAKPINARTTKNDQELLATIARCVESQRLAKTKANKHTWATRARRWRQVARLRGLALPVQTTAAQ